MRMKLICVLLVGALALPSVAGARDSGHRLKTAGVVTSAVGLALAIVGAVLTGYAESHPPRDSEIINGTLRQGGAVGEPYSPPPNTMLSGGAGALAIGAAALGVGIPLWIAGDRQEHRPTLSATASGLRLSF